VLVRRLVARDFGRAARATAGLLVVQIDGLSLPVLRNALRAGRVPVLEQLIRQAIEARHPGLIEMLASHPGIGSVIVRSAAGHALARGAYGWLDLTGGGRQGLDPLAAYGRPAAEDLRRR
jgi:hypothetical protein